MSTARRIVRWLLVGRRDGVRAAVRRRLGILRWLDRGPGGTPAEPPPPPAPAAAAPAPATGWTELLDAADLAPGEVAEVLIGERPVAVACVAAAGGRRFHAVDGTCPHAGGPLGDGVVEDGALTCPWHGWSYDLATGQSRVDPAVRVEVFETTERNGRVCARLQPPSGGG